MDCKFCGQDMEVVSSWPVHNPSSVVAQARAAFWECDGCGAGYDTSNETWAKPDPYHSKDTPMMFFERPFHMESGEAEAGILKAIVKEVTK